MKADVTLTLRKSASGLVHACPVSWSGDGATGPGRASRRDGASLLHGQPVANHARSPPTRGGDDRARSKMHGQSRVPSPTGPPPAPGPGAHQGVSDPDGLCGRWPRHAHLHRHCQTPYAVHGARCLLDCRLHDVDVWGRCRVLTPEQQHLACPSSTTPPSRTSSTLS